MGPVGLAGVPCHRPGFCYTQSRWLGAVGAGAAQHGGLGALRVGRQARPARRVADLLDRARRAARPALLDRRRGLARLAGEHAKPGRHVGGVGGAGFRLPVAPRCVAAVDRVQHPVLAAARGAAGPPVQHVRGVDLGRAGGAGRARPARWAGGPSQTRRAARAGLAGARVPGRRAACDVDRRLHAGRRARVSHRVPGRRVGLSARLARRRPRRAALLAVADPRRSDAGRRLRQFDRRLAVGQRAGGHPGRRRMAGARVLRLAQQSRALSRPDRPVGAGGGRVRRCATSALRAGGIV